MPRPSTFVVKKGWNIRSAPAGSSPVPVSFTAIRTERAGELTISSTLAEPSGVPSNSLLSRSSRIVVTPYYFSSPLLLFNNA